MFRNCCFSFENGIKNICSGLFPSNKFEGMAALSIPLALATLPQVGLMITACYGGYKFLSNKWDGSGKPISFSAQDPSRPVYLSNMSNPTPQMLNPFQKKIAILRTQSTILGVSVIQCKITHALIPTYIEVQEMADVSVFRMKRLDNDREMGSAKVLAVTNQGRYYGNKTASSFSYSDEQEFYYGDEGARLDKAFLDDIDSFNKQFRNVGSNIIKSINQFYGKKFNCRMSLVATEDAGVFYYKLGFRSTNHAVNRDLSSGIKKGGALFLPRWAREQWLQDIKQNPICFLKLDEHP